MNQSIQNILKQNITWIAGLFLCLLVLMASGLGLIDSNEDSVKSASESAGNKSTPRSKLEEKYIKIISAPPQSEKSVEMQTQEYIEEYQGKSEDINTRPEDVPEYIFAIGSLTKDRLKDPSKAKDYFERIILEFPEHQKSALAHRMLYACYKELGDEENARWVCSEALKKFDPESMDYKWAQIQLGLINDPRVEQGTLKIEAAPVEITTPPLEEVPVLQENNSDESFSPQ